MHREIAREVEDRSSETFAANQLSATGFSYDAAGNMLTDGTNTYAYNAESEIKSAAGVTYTYDGDGNRVEKSSGTVYWYGAGTEILDESNSSGTITNEYVFFGGKRVAMRNVTSGTIYYYEEDMLGSSRTMVQAGQTSVCYDADFYPFGGERDITNTCTQHYKFEGKERDTETGNDDFGARYYTSRLGRWLSADWSSVPEAVPYANLTNPQTLNLYAMVSDNPETFADLDGHVTCGQTLPGSLEDCTKAAPSPAATTGGNDPDTHKNGMNTPNSTTLQALADTIIGLGKSAVNQVISLNNTVNDAVNSAISPFTSFKFGDVPELQPSNANQKTAMASSDIALALVPVGGEEKIGASLGKEVTEEVIERQARGADEATSRFIKEKIEGKTNSVTHQVTSKEGEIIHQHQTHIGTNGTKRQFPDSWIKYPRIPKD